MPALDGAPRSQRQEIKMNCSAAADLVTTRRGFLTAAVAATSLGMAVPYRETRAEELLRPFTANIPQAALDDLQLRLRMTRWPDKETVDDQSQGIQLARLKPLVEYWQAHYDWRKAEARLNTLPQFVTEIDGIDIHFIHVRSKHADALPAIITHGWPGSVFENLKIIDPLTDPTAHGGTAADAFDVVIPSLPASDSPANRPRQAGAPTRLRAPGCN